MAQLVAHRGQSANLPENTLEAMRQAIACGATAVEFDLQLSADQVPLVCHDRSLQRTAGVDLAIADNTSAELVRYSVGEAARLAGRFPVAWLPTLAQMVTLLQQAPQVTAFVELKDESLERFGVGPFVAQVVAQLRPVAAQCVVIANSLDALLQTREASPLPVGWILHRWDGADRLAAQRHTLDYLVLHHRLCWRRRHDFAADPWHWMAYETCEPSLARALFAQGIGYVESNDICAMLQQMPELRAAN